MQVCTSALSRSAPLRHATADNRAVREKHNDPRRDASFLPTPASEFLLSIIGDAAHRRIFHTLDGLRGVAALAVVVLHTSVMLAPIDLGSSYLAVDLFFMMSGIVIAHSYDHRLAADLSARRFTAIRLIRLLPLYFVGFLGATLVQILAQATGTSHWDPADLAIAWVSMAFMLPHIGGGPVVGLYPLNVPAWSLAWEIVSNVVYALLFKWWTPKVLAVGIAVAAVALVAVAVWYGDLDRGSQWAGWIGGPVRVGFGFTVGVWIERRRAQGRLIRISVPPVLLLALLLVVLAVPAAWGWPKDVAIVLLIFPLMCVAAIQSEGRGVRLFAFLGLISYPLYVTHAAFRYERMLPQFWHGAESAAPFSGIALITVMVAVAWILARFVDVPVRQWLTRRWLGGAGPRPAQASAG
ncbi:acyltransferase [Sphingomonas sp. KR1UV-12]|uniref:Acyltransferase n=1 Tax=Sphingomonas aurea TaxID=3063994 RepID=A0ABT9EIS3_9SPHN|nr:acyltransferase [Sphingomonas sp. KR1UV-12]MDP1026701.1 acyltransferase [Sphingomonas sp. KR1UV-12]